MVKKRVAWGVFMSKYSRPGFKRYRYKQLRDVPVDELSDDQFEYVVKSLLHAAMGRYKKMSRRSRRGNS